MESCVHFPRHSDPILHEFQDLIDLAQICDRMQTTAFDVRIKKPILKLAVEDSWEAFKHASERQDLELAKSVIANFPQNRYCPPCLYHNVSKSAFRGLDEDGLWELLILRWSLVPLAEDASLHGQAD